MEEEYFQQQQSGENVMLRTAPSWVESLTGLLPLEYRNGDEDVFATQEADLYGNEDMGVDEAQQENNSMDALMQELTAGEYDDPKNVAELTPEMTTQLEEVMQRPGDLTLDNVIVIQQMDQNDLENPAALASQLTLSGVDPSVASTLGEALSKTRGLALDDVTWINSQLDHTELPDNGAGGGGGGAEEGCYLKRVFSLFENSFGLEDEGPLTATQETAQEQPPAEGEGEGKFPLPESPADAAYSPPAQEGFRGEEGEEAGASRYPAQAAELEREQEEEGGRMADGPWEYADYCLAPPGEAPTWNYQPRRTSQPEEPTGRSYQRASKTGRDDERWSERKISWRDETIRNLRDGSADLRYDAGGFLPLATGGGGGGAGEGTPGAAPLAGPGSSFALPPSEAERERKRKSLFAEGPEGRERRLSVTERTSGSSLPWSIGSGSDEVAPVGVRIPPGGRLSVPAVARQRTESMVTHKISTSSGEPPPPLLLPPPLPPPLQRRVSYHYRNKDQLGPHEQVWRPEDTLYREYDHQVVVEFKASFLKVNDIDTLSQQFESEIYIQAKWQEEAFIGMDPNELENLMPEDLWEPHLIILNTAGEFDQERRSFVVRYEEGYEAPVVLHRWRFKGLFREQLELQHFPFDVQDLTIQVSTERSVDEIKMKHDQHHLSSVNTRAFHDSQEWALYKHVECTHRTTSLEYASSTIHPILVFSCRVRRKVWYFIWNIVFIVFLVMVLSFLTTAVDPTSSDRLANTMTLFLTMVAFKLVVKQSLPTISYLTYLDIYVLGSLLYLVVFALENSVMCYMARWMDHDLVEAYDQMVCLMLASVIITLHLLLIIHVQVMALKRHRLMSHNDQQYAIQARELMKRLDKKQKRKMQQKDSPVPTVAATLPI